MSHYNIRIGENTSLDVSVPQDYQPADHAVRVLHMVNGDLVIGTVVRQDENSPIVYMTLPMYVDMMYCEEHEEEEFYEFVPYLRNIIKFDVRRPTPVPFNLDHCISPVEPSDHLVRNYYRVLLMQKAIADEIHGPAIPAKETMH